MANNYNVKFLKGTAESYRNLVTKDVNTFYYIGGKDLYLGEIKLSNAAEIEAAVNSLEDTKDQVAAIKEQLGSFTVGGYDALVQRVEANEAAITLLQEKDTELEGAISGHTTRLDGIDGTLESHGKTLESLNGSIEGLKDTTGTLRTDIDAARDIADANATAIGILNGNASQTGSVDEKINTAINEWAALISEDGKVNTYKELIDYVEEHGSDFTALVGRVDNHDDMFATLNADADTEGSIKKKIAEAIAAENLDQYATDEDVQDILAQVGELSSTINGVNDKVNANAELITANQNAIEQEELRASGVEEHLSERILVLEKMTGLEGDGTEAGSVAALIQAAKEEAIATAKEESAEYTDAQILETKNYADGKATTAKSEAISETQTWANGQFATKAQGEKADSALQKADITTGKTNGTIGVKGEDVAVFGLGSAAYKSVEEFDPANAAANALDSAKSYTDAEVIEANTYAETKAGEALTAAQDYTDSALTWGEIPATV